MTLTKVNWGYWGLEGNGIRMTTSTTLHEILKVKTNNIKENVRDNLPMKKPFSLEDKKMYVEETLCPLHRWVLYTPSLKSRNWINSNSNESNVNSKGVVIIFFRKLSKYSISL